MTVRELLFSANALDPELNALGINTSTLYANGAPDTPQETLFAVLRWGPETPGLVGQRGRGRTTDREVTLWVYDRDRDYDRINSAIKRWCAIMDGLEARSTGADSTDGWVSSCEWQGDGDDGYDDQYERIYRSSTYRIIASGD